MASRDDIKKALLFCLRANLKAHSIAEATLGESIDAYHSVLADLEPETLEAAVTHYVSSATFFPTPGDIRKSALELKLLSLGVPTASEAWAQVQKATRYRDSTFCKEGIELAEAIDQTEGYWSSIDAYSNHVESCELCIPGGPTEEYDHPTVKEAVVLMGGLSRVLTGNETSDRARFQKGYNEIIERETVLYGMPSPVRAYLKKQKGKATLAGSINQIAKINHVSKRIKKQ
jgi:hypothetical protein